MNALAQNNQSIETRMIQSLWLGALVAFGVLTLLAIIFAPWSQVLSVVVGGLIAIANFKLLQRTILGVLRPEKPGSPMANILIKYYLRFIATCVVLFVLIRMEWVEPLGLLVGLSSVIVSVIVWGALQACKTDKEAV